MKDFLLCLADVTGRVACFLKAGGSGLEYVSGTPGAWDKVSFALRELNEHGVHVLDEHFSPGHIDVDSVKVGPEDPRYLDGCAHEFRSRGWKACLYPRPEAEVWQKLFELPVSEQLRAAFAERLGALPKDGLEELRGILDHAAEDFERIKGAQPPSP